MIFSGTKLTSKHNILCKKKEPLTLKVQVFICFLASLCDILHKQTSGWRTLVCADENSNLEWSDDMVTPQLCPLNPLSRLHMSKPSRLSLWVDLILPSLPLLLPLSHLKTVSVLHLPSFISLFSSAYLHLSRCSSTCSLLSLKNHSETKLKTIND